MSVLIYNAHKSVTAKYKTVYVKNLTIEAKVGL
jgi:hypothetical protein